MFTIIVSSFFVIGAFCAQIAPIERMPVDTIEARITFDKLVNMHGREYQKGSQEYEKRFTVFQDNVKRIEAARKNERGDARYGMNMFFDIAKDEFQTQYKMPKQRIPATAAEAAAAAGTAHSCLGGGATVSLISEKQRQALPSSYDWRQHKPAVLTPIKNQGACGSCWAFSTMETLESSWALKTGNLTELAPQQLVDCSHACSMEKGMKVCNQGCGGGWPWAAVTTLIQEGGAEPSSSYPYTAMDGTCKFNPNKIVARAKNYTCISGPHTASADDIAHALMTQPLSIALDAEWFQFYLGGVSDPYICGKTSLDHAVQIIGYGSQAGWISGTVDYWIIRNSWGASWGDSGTMKLLKGANICGVGNAVMQIEAA